MQNKLDEVLWLLTDNAFSVGDLELIEYALKKKIISTAKGNPFA